MPRIARIVIPDCPHHITQRGNRREDIFFSDVDRRRYLELLEQYSLKHGLAVLSYCLMSNHVHMIAVPQKISSLAAALLPVHLRYAQHVNWTQGLSGRLWQGRFFSCALDEQHLWAAIRYVERNPVQAGLVDHAEQWPWSSAPAHCGLRTDSLLSDPCGLIDEIGDWSVFLRDDWEGQNDQSEQVQAIRSCTHTGRPAGSDSFLKRAENLLGRKIQTMSRGRPRKKPA